MRSITITYQYDGPEADWRETVETFVAAVNADNRISGRFVYQIAVADDGITRIHWGRWDTPETLKTMQGSDYFKTFAAKLHAIAGDSLKNTGADVALRTEGWG